MLSEIQDFAKRLEQQLTAYERLHADELKKYQDQFTAFQRLQTEELQMLRDELEQLNAEIAALKEVEAKPTADAAPTAASSGQVEMTITRRDLLTGKIRPHP